ncbi:MAG: methyltransferase [Sulfurospirillum sp.]|nr:methyltransferase [Sulfurospirillum sp.]
MTLNLLQQKNGYRYNSDSLILYDFISSFSLKGSLLEIGSGCGIVGLLLKRDFVHIDLTQIELQADQALINEQNAQANALDTSVLVGNFLEYVNEQKFDFIVSNPPFYTQGAKMSESSSLAMCRHQSYLPLDAMLTKISQIIKPRGSFIFCYDAKQIDVVLTSLITHKFKLETLRFVHAKQNSEAHLMLLHVKKSSRSLVRVLPPLFLHDIYDKQSEEITNIYKKSNTMSQEWSNY